MTKKKKILIIVLVSVLVLTGGVLGIVFGVILPHPGVPSPSMQDVHVTWKEVRGAVGYCVEYYYPDYMEAPLTVDMRSNSCAIPRYAGDVQVRVKSYAKYVEWDSKYSDYIHQTVPGLKLNAPVAVKFFKAEDGGYQILQHSWKAVTYAYDGKVKNVPYYDICAVPAGETLAERLKTDKNITRSLSDLINYKFSGLTPGTWQIYMRAVNHKVALGGGGVAQPFEDNGIDPVELRDRFLTSDWTMSVLTVV